MPDSGIRLLPWVGGEEPLLWPGVKDPGFREVVVGQLRYPGPQGTVGLAASPERASPEPDDLGPEVAKSRIVSRHGMVGEEASDHLRQPSPLFGDGLVPSLSQLLLDLPKLRPQARAPGLPLQQEGVSAGRCRGD